MLHTIQDEQDCRNVIGQNDQPAHHALMLVQVGCNMSLGHSGCKFSRLHPRVRPVGCKLSLKL